MKKTQLLFLLGLASLALSYTASASHQAWADCQSQQGQQPKDAKTTQDSTMKAKKSEPCTESGRDGLGNAAASGGQTVRFRARTSNTASLAEEGRKYGKSGYAQQ